MMTIGKWLAAAFCCGCLAFISGCGGEGETDGSPVIVRFKEKVLTARMLSHYIPEGVGPADSARYAAQYIEQWVKEQAIMDKALSDDETLAERIEFKVQDYKAKLVMHEYQTRLIKDSITEKVSKAAIQKYYEDHKKNFRSKETLFSYFYVVSTTGELAEAAEWMQSDDPADIVKLTDWAAKNALEYKLDSSYVGETQVNHVSKGYFGSLQKAPIGKFIRWNGVIQGERRRYMFKMMDVVENGAALPLRLCREKITNLILNDQKVKLIERSEERILRDARSKNYIVKE